MARSKTREITIKESKGGFSIFSKGSSGKGEYDFDGISALRQLLSNEKARMIYTIKNENPKSIYGLAKTLKRPFKAVMDDVKLLERFGFIDLLEEKTKKRVRHRPIIVVDNITIHVRI